MRDGAGTNHSAGTGPVLDHESLLENLSEFLGHDAGRSVAAAAWWVRHNDPDDVIRPAFCIGDSSRVCQRQQGGES